MLFVTTAFSLCVSLPTISTGYHEAARDNQPARWQTHPIEFTAAAANDTSPAIDQSGLGPNDRDIIYRRGNSIIKCIIETETIDDVRYTIPGGTRGPSTSIRWGTIDRVVYFGMDGGAWAKGNELRLRGDYESAADLFHQLASSGKREWEKVRGSFAEGECLELADKPDQAAEAFDVIVQQYGGNPTAKPPIPRQRLWMEALYRKGVCLAMVKKKEEAQKIAAQLFDLGKKENMSAADVRANGVLAIIAVHSDNPMKFNEYYRKATFNAERETDSWFHFRFLIAEKLRVVAKKPEPALGVYKDIQAAFQTLPASRDRLVQVALGIGMCYADSGKSSLAVTELLRIDVMSYGSPEQQCLARATAARLMWQEAQKTQSDSEAMKNQRTADWVKELQATARFVAQAAADGPAGCPAAEEAKKLLTGMQ